MCVHQFIQSFHFLIGKVYEPDGVIFEADGAEQDEGGAEAGFYIVNREFPPVRSWAGGGAPVTNNLNIERLRMLNVKFKDAYCFVVHVAKGFVVTVGNMFMAIDNTKSPHHN